MLKCIIVSKKKHTDVIIINVVSGELLLCLK